MSGIEKIKDAIVTAAPHADIDDFRRRLDELELAAMDWGDKRTEQRQAEELLIAAARYEERRDYRAANVLLREVVRLHLHFQLKLPEIP